MAILIITNRNVQKKFKDHRAFGDGFNSRGPMELRLATAEKKQGKWRVDMVAETGRLVNTVSSTHVFGHFRDSLINNKRNCVLFIHGFRQTLLENLEKCRSIEKYGVDVIGFSWPSQPGGFVVAEYRQAQRVAELSAPALDRVFEKLIYNFQTLGRAELARCNVSFNFMVHSLGNYVFQNFVEKRLLGGETRLFDNIILHQADVSDKTHARWVSKLRYAKRIYVTRNEDDKILDLSNLINANRLGNTLGRFPVKRVNYTNPLNH